MNLGSYSTWDFYPRYLNPEEVNHPLIVIREFFSSDWLPGHLEALKTWRTFVTEDRHYTDRQNNPANLLYTYLLHVQLVEACFLLMQSRIGREKDNREMSEQDKQLLQEKNSWLHFPEGLSREELLDPCLVLESFFKDYNLPLYRAFLYQWLEKGLSRFAADEAMPANEIIRVYENLERLYQAAWLIHQREMKPVLKKTIENKEEVVEKAIPAEAMTIETSIAEGKETTESDVKIKGADQTLNPVFYEPSTLDTATNGERQQLLAIVISIVKHKVPTVEVVIYLGAISGKSDEMVQVYLLVIVSNDEKKQGHELTSTIEESCKPFAVVTALVHRAGIFLKAVERKNYFFCQSLSNPVLYLSGNLLLPVPPQIDIVLLKQKREKNFQHWYGQANEFLNGAGFYLNGGVYGLASFSLHQAAENALTAIIHSTLGYRLNLHNLARLLRITGMFTPELKQVFSLDTTEGAGLFNILQKAYNNLRYNDDFKPEEASVRLLFDLVSKLLETVKNIYGQAYRE